MIQRKWYKWRSSLLRQPTNKGELLQMLDQAMKEQLINADALDMIEGVVNVANRHVREVMVPRSQMVVLQQDQSFETLLPLVTKSSHSRFPVIGKDHNDIVGILLAKDLLALINRTVDDKLQSAKHFLHPAIFVPESKRLDELLKEFQSNHSHMAIVVDEYSGTAGLVTIEDVLEQIVGNIEDEYDSTHAETTYIQKEGDHSFLVKALTPIEYFNEHFGVDWSNKDVSTVGGFVAQLFGHVPQKGERISVPPFQITIRHAEKRRVQLLQFNQSNSVGSLSNARNDPRE